MFSDPVYKFGMSLAGTETHNFKLHGKILMFLVFDT